MVGRGSDPILWRVDEKGEVIWVTRLLKALSNETSSWDLHMADLLHHRVRPYLFVGGLVRGVKDDFVFAGNLKLNIGVDQREPYIVKFRDPDLADIQCPETYRVHATILLLRLHQIWRQT